jgi:hypothetical protein
MWKLTIEDDEGKQTSLPLAHEEYTLGRGETNAIRLTDRNVSRKHSVLKKTAGWVLSRTCRATTARSSTTSAS